MTDSRIVRPVSRLVHGKIRPPGSKSITNRALICAALAQGKSRLTGVLDSDDTRVMVDSLKRLGFCVEHDARTATATIAGIDGKIPNAKADLFVGNSGTSIRFLTAMLALAGGDYRLDGVERMRERPIGPLVDALRQFGSEINALSPNGCPPVSIGTFSSSRTEICVSGNLSSQYLSGILMAVPQLDREVTIKIKGKLVSVPYVEMTIAVMKSFGVEVESVRDGETPESFFVSADQQYRSCEYEIEPDASAASYFFAIPAITGGSATIEGLNSRSLQGDVEFVRCLEAMGCDVLFGSGSITVSGKATTGIDIDMGNISDTVQTLASVALFVDGPTTIRNVAHNRVKETDRIGNLVIELRKLGVQIDEREDGLTIHPGPMRAATFDTYDDHRMAMSFALIGLKQAGIEVRDPGCVSKTYPNFFEDLQMFVESNG